MAETPDHIQILEDGGLVSQSVLIIPVTEESIETFVIDTCSECDEEDLDETDTVYIWGEPRGGIVMLHVYCCEECVSLRLKRYADEIQKDVIITYVGYD